MVQTVKNLQTMTSAGACAKSPTSQSTSARGRSGTGKVCVAPREVERIDWGEAKLHLRLTRDELKSRR